MEGAGMIEVYRKLRDLLDARERRMFVLLGAIMIVVAFAEVLGISTVFVLLGVLADPAAALEKPWLGWLNEMLGLDLFTFQVVLAGGVLVVVLAGLAIKALGTYAIIRFSNMRGATISARLLRAYLSRPYAWSLTRNTSEIANRVLAEADRIVGQVLMPGLLLLANILMAGALIVFLLVVDPLVALSAATLIGGGYAAIFLWLRQRMRWHGRKVLTHTETRFRLTGEATGGFKEVKLAGLEDSYSRRHERLSRQRAHHQARIQIIGRLPRYALEALTFAVLVGIVFALLLRSGGDIVAAIPILGVIAFAVMRLLPALQQIYGALAAIRGGTPVLEAIHADYMAALAENGGRLAALPPPPAPLALTRALVLEEVRYAYPTAARAALQGVSLAIPARATVGVVGGTGAGKTTLIDVILGLLVPQAGALLVDGVALDASNRRAWQASIGYVPQSIYLTDDTVAANIAFGVPPEAIDHAAVERAARIAALHDFVIAELPQGYNTVVGERGVRLSGGQRQRIGIARALYHDPSLLILDEATSALDTLTERAVMEAVDNLRDDKTVILIAHRLSTVRGCDTIFLMEEGRVAASGSYDDLVARNETFRRMTAVG